MCRSRVTMLFAMLMTIAVNPTSFGQAQGSASLASLVALIEKQAEARKPTTLAAEVSQEGHWSFANAGGERFTTGSADELRRVLPTLAPEASKPGTRLTLIVTEDSVFRYRQHFLALALASAASTDVMVAVDGEAYALLRRADRLYAGIRPGLLVELSDRRVFDETVWQLAHPLRSSVIRVLALEPGGAAGVAPTPKLDPHSGRPLTDLIAPAGLIQSLRTLRGQTVILTARRDGEALVFRPSSGAELTLPAKDVLAAAEAADVNLVVLQSATPRQPGTRSWMWQRVSISGLNDAMGRAHLADFLNALATPQSRLLVSAVEERTGRIGLRAEPLKDDGRTGFGEALSNVASSIVGQVVVTGVEASLRNRARQRELDRRILPGVPSMLQWIYLGLLGLGLAGHDITSRWWARVWPPEDREGYTSAIGHLAARAVRTGIYVVLFAPLVGLAAAPMAVWRLVRRAP